MQKNFFKKISGFFYVVFLSYFWGCTNKDFTPFGEMEKKFTVYSILDTRQENQFVEIQQLYFDNNLKKMQGTTKVFLSDSYNNIFSLKDTSIEGYNDYSVFYLPNYKLKRNYNYRLTVINDDFPDQYEWADTYVSPLQIMNVSIRLYEPPRDSLFLYIRHEYTVIFSNNPGPYYDFHMYIVYEIASSTKPVSKMIEIPIDIAIYGIAPDAPIYTEIPMDDVKELIYPRIFKTGEVTKYLKWENNLRKAVYRCECIQWAYRKLQEDNQPQDITIKKAFVIVRCVDENLYHYKLNESGVEDPLSIRLDKPCWTNLKGKEGDGLGVFGSITSDTVYFKIPYEIIFRYHNIDGQNY